MKKKLLITVVALISVTLVISVAFLIKNYRDKKAEDEPYKPASGEFYDKDQLPDWDFL